MSGTMPQRARAMRQALKDKAERLVARPRPLDLWWRFASGGIS